MTGKTRNSMAAIMTVLVTVVMWMTAAIGAIKVDDHDISVPELAAGLVGVLVVVCAVVFVSLELRKILATLAAGYPFVPENAVRLTRIAIAIAITQLMRYVIAIFVGLMVTGTSLEFSVDLIAWASVAALFILSQVFREGTRLRDEEKMTI